MEYDNTGERWNRWSFAWVPCVVLKFTGPSITQADALHAYEAVGCSLCGDAGQIVWMKRMLS